MVRLRAKAAILAPLQVSNFNSNVVRLRGIAIHLHIAKPKFQFPNGAIKSQDRIPKPYTTPLFQFPNGAIKREEFDLSKYTAFPSGGIESLGDAAKNLRTY